MRIRLWGVRGSLATPMSTPLLRDKVNSLLSEASAADLADDAAMEAYLDRSPHAWTYGGNTSCVEVSFGDATLVLDAGTGLRSLGLQLAQDGRAANMAHELHLLFTHFHWDHICGFPFFGPLYVPGRKLDVWSGRSDSERLLKVQMGDAHFPVKWDMLNSKVTCHQIPEDETVMVGGAEVRVLPLIHPDKAYGYRITYRGRSVCYLTDTEVSRNPNKVAQQYADFVRGADVVIVDAMYGFLEYHDKVNFGHSTIFNFIDFFQDTDLGELVIFHHDPMASDPAVTKLCTDAQRYAELVAPGARWKISAAREGQEWELSDT
jgi:phosphoribosyl 1,2-cyclic phosphodiesterase